MKVARTKRPWWNKAIGRFRLFLGLCPECNSDAPKLYACPTCQYYTGVFPPTKDTKDKWWTRFTVPLCQHGTSMMDPCLKCSNMLGVAGYYRSPRKG